MLVIADLEGTLTKGRAHFALHKYLKTQRRALRYDLMLLTRLPGFALLKAHVLSQVWFNRWLLEGELRQFKGEHINGLRHAAEWGVDQVMWPKRFVDVLAELEAYRQDNHRILIASGALQPIVEAFAQRIGAEALGSEIELDANGCITGKLLGDPNVRSVKLARVQRILNGSPPLAVYSNGEGDQEILKLAAEPVIVYPAVGIRLIAKKHGWRILEKHQDAPERVRPDMQTD